MPETSTAASLAQFCQRVKALRHRPIRDNERCFWIEGIRNFVWAHDARLYFDTVVYSRILLKSAMAEMLSRRLHASGIHRLSVTPEQFRACSSTPHASGIGAIVRQHWTPLAEVCPAPTDCVVVLEAIRSAGNLGTILRTAEACGAAAVIFVGPTSDPFDPVTVRASMGGLFHTRLVRTAPTELGRWAVMHAVHLVGLSPRAPHLWNVLPAAGPVGLVLGAEQEGLSPALRKMCRHFAALPMTGRADSLNVGVAAGIALYEVLRQRCTR